MNKWKIILGGVAGAVGIAGAAISPLSYKSFSKPTAQTLDGSHANTYKSGFGKYEKNKNFLVRPVAENKEWWDWSYNTRFKPYKDKNSESISNWFSSVTSSFEGSSFEGSSLAAKCRDIYHKDLSGSTFTYGNQSATDNVTELLKKNIKEFCAIEGTVELQFNANS